MMDYEQLIPDPEMDDFDREERCRRVLKNVGRAIFIRFVVVALVIWACTRAEPSGWLIGLILLVVLITLSALPPLVKEWKTRRAELKELLEREKNDTP